MASTVSLRHRYSARCFLSPWTNFQDALRFLTSIGKSTILRLTPFGHSAIRRVAWLAVLGGVTSMTAGCMALKLALGIRTRLDDKPVTEIKASIADAGGVGPGQSTRLIIVAETKDGKELVTVGPGHGKVLFSSFKFTPTLAEVTTRGYVVMPGDPRVTEGKLSHVHIETLGHPDVTADIDIPVRYDVAFVADRSGPKGVAGYPGSNGRDGINGSDGSTDPRNPSPGHDGSNGGNGDNGGNGSDGGSGENVRVWLTLRPGTHPMLQARVVGETGESLYLIDPQGGSLTVKADGGPGGNGGAGGSGGRGGRGGSGAPAGRDGRAGANGNPGRDGRDGPPGTIRVSIDPLANPYLDRLHLSNHGGNGTTGPAPSITIEPVAQIW